MQNRIKTLLLIILTHNFIIAQIDSVSNEKKFALYLGISPTLYTKLNINESLTKNNLSTINSFTSPFIIGFNYNFNKLQFTFEGAISSNFKSKNNFSKTRFNTISDRIGFSYKIISRNDFKLYFGLNYSFTSYAAYIYLKSSAIDFNSIDTSSTKGLLNILNYSHNVGAAFTFIFFDKSKSSKHTIIRIGYDYAINQKKWYSEYATLRNAPYEKFDRFYISVARPIMQR